MRFVHILIGSADPRSVNGVNKVVHWLAATQTEMGLDSQVWALKPNGAPVTHEHNYPIQVFQTTKSRFILSTELRRAIESLPEGTWVQLHSVYIPELTSIAKVLKKRGISYRSHDPRRLSLLVRGPVARIADQEGDLRQVMGELDAEECGHDSCDWSN